MSEEKPKVCAECKALRKSDPKKYFRIGFSCPDCGAKCGCTWHDGK